MRRLSLLLLAVVALASCGTDRPATRQTVTARGVGEVVGVPDVLHISLSVETRGPTARATLADDSARTQAVIDRLTQAGVARRDLRTTSLTLNPVYDDKGQRIVAYTASNAVTVTLRDLAKAGAVIDAAADAGGDATRLDGLQFAIDDTSDLYASARMDAVRRARAQARQLARAAGVDLGRVRSIGEASIDGGDPIPYRSSLDDEAAAAVPLEPGTQKLRLQVTVVYDID
jgi:uncharacterized protein YggE